MNQINPFLLWRQESGEAIKNFVSNKNSYLEHLLPEIAVQLNVYQVLDILKRKLGDEKFFKALNPNEIIESPVSLEKNTDWLKKSKMAGVNPRTINGFFNLLKYALTLPSNIDSIHILPIWEPGVVGSLYGKVSWNINPEFFSQELFNVFPNLYNVELQLKVIINLLHALGKKVGLDVIPHTDRFSEMVLTRPQFFEWVKKDDKEIIEFADDLHTKVQNEIWNWLNTYGTANYRGLELSKNDFFNSGFTIEEENYRTEVLFGLPNEYQKRQQRRIDLMTHLVYHKFETLPVTMGPPFRGLKVNPNDFTIDERGIKWNEFEFIEPQQFSRVFGPLTRYKFFHLKGNTQELDFSNPNKGAWDYFNRQYMHQCSKFNFDFMRGDMAHVQMRIEGVPKKIPKYYDPFKSLKSLIHKNGQNYFGFFAETFLAPENTMAYGIEEDHLEAIDADVTLGDLQSKEINSEAFKIGLVQLFNIETTRKFKECFTLITADKDDPRFDQFYVKGNHFRYFIFTFLTSWPAYYSLGFEQRNLHLKRGKNEEYSKLYVFRISDPEQTDKFTTGPFIWGENYEQFENFEQMKKLRNHINLNSKIKWIEEPSVNASQLSWQIGNFIFYASLEEQKSLSIKIKDKKAEILYNSASFSPNFECRIYKLK